MNQVEYPDIDVQLIDFMGGDRAIVAAAQVSTIGDQSLKRLTQDTKVGLINYLMKNRHGTPFEHSSMTFYIKAPIFVFREFHRHRIGWSYNEESGRYKQLDAHFYMPTPERPGMMQKPGGKPGYYEYVDATEEEYDLISHELSDVYQIAYNSYLKMLNMGVAREVARMVLPVGIFSSMYATCNPRSLMAFLGLRTQDEQATYPSKPQWEIDRPVARAMEGFFMELFPVTYDAFCQNGRVAP